MDIEDFTNSQKTLYVTKPKKSQRLILNEEFEDVSKQGKLKIPFISLIQGHEAIEATHKRWLLYNDLSLEFHKEVGDILQRSNLKIDKDLQNILQDASCQFESLETNETRNMSENNFKNVFIVGADNSFKLPSWDHNASPVDNLKSKLAKPTLPSYGNSNKKLKMSPSLEVEAKKMMNNTFTVVIDMVSNECPNIRMMTKRSMFQLLNSITKCIEIEDDEYDSNSDGNEKYDLKTITALGLEYDLSIVQNFQKLFRKNLHIVFNYKEIELFNYQVLDEWINILNNLSEQCRSFLSITNIFQVSTNLANVEKNLKIKTIRVLKSKGNYHVLKINDPLSLNTLINDIFKCFIKLSNGKLTFSARFIADIIIKLKNSTDSKKKLIHTLIKILDYSLMSYFYSSPFAVFLDIINFEQFYNDETYGHLLLKCPSFILFVDSLVMGTEHSKFASNDAIKIGDIKDVLNLEKGNKLKDLFVEMLVETNPVTQKLLQVTKFLESDQNKIFSYNIFELYYHISIDKSGSLEKYLVKNWPFLGPRLKSEKNKSTLLLNGLTGQNYIFHELFTLDNQKISGVISQNLFPTLRGNMEENLLSPERITHRSKSESYFKLGELMDYPINYLFSLYREAGIVINVYDFYAAFKSILPKDDIVEFCKKDASLKTIHALIDSDGLDTAFDKIALIWFMQCVTDMKYSGILKNELTAKRKFNGVVEKEIWRGL
ncbi:hypothetical protein ACO0QE_000581 [Hanseniaspora vineae]